MSLFVSWYCPVCPAGASCIAVDDEWLEREVEYHELVAHGIGLPLAFETNRFTFLRERMPSDDWPRDSSGFPTLGDRRPLFARLIDAELLEAGRALGVVTS